METVFITIHGELPRQHRPLPVSDHRLDLSSDARIRYVSDSIEDILGYQPHEIRGQSCWDYFHPTEIPFARAVHGRGIYLDKVSALNYCQIKHKDGSWVGCECVFTIVYDVLVSCTSIYRRGARSRRTSPEILPSSRLTTSQSAPSMAPVSGAFSLPRHATLGIICCPLFPTSSRQSRRHASTSHEQRCS